MHHTMHTFVQHQFYCNNNQIFVINLKRTEQQIYHRYNRKIFKNEQEEDYGENLERAVKFYFSKDEPPIEFVLVPQSKQQDDEDNEDYSFLGKVT